MVILKNGKCKVINRKTGKIKLIKNYLNGLLHGEYIYYWDNGNIRFRGRYEHSQRVGIWRSFSKTGEIISEEISSNNIQKKSTRLKISYSQLEEQLLLGNELFHN